MTADEVEAYAELAHNVYEAAAAESGWESNPASRKPWSEVPEANRAATRAMVAAVDAHLRGSLAAQIEALCDWLIETEQDLTFDPDDYHAQEALLTAARLVRGEIGPDA